jgi:hypothetical protein
MPYIKIEICFIAWIGLNWLGIESKSWLPELKIRVFVTKVAKAGEIHEKFSNLFCKLGWKELRSAQVVFPSLVSVLVSLLYFRCFRGSTLSFA